MNSNKNPPTSLLLLLIATFCPSCSADCPDVLVSYELRVYTFWTQEAFPKHYPDTRPVAQWSKLYGVSHTDSLSLFQVGTLATKALQQYAELGRTDEYEATLNHSHVLSQFYAPPIRKGVGLTSTAFFVDNQHSKVSFVMKIHPSPDWFIGLDRLALCRNGSWLENITMDATPMDAGTDEGFTFTAPDYANEDPEPVFTINSSYPREPYGSFYYNNLTALPRMAQFVINKVEEYARKAENTTQSPHPVDPCSDIETTFRNILNILFNSTNDTDTCISAKPKVVEDRNGDQTNDQKSNVTHLDKQNKDAVKNKLGDVNINKTENKSPKGSETNNINGDNTSIHSTSYQLEGNQTCNVHPWQAILDEIDASDRTSENITRSSSETLRQFQTRILRKKYRRYMTAMIQVLNQTLNESEDNNKTEKVHKDKEGVKIINVDGKENGETNHTENVEKQKNDALKEEIKSIAKTNGPSSRGNFTKETGNGSDAPKSKASNGKKSSNKRRHDKSKQKKEASR